jgi:hypothetical protein
MFRRHAWVLRAKGLVRAASFAERDCGATAPPTQEARMTNADPQQQTRAAIQQALGPEITVDEATLLPEQKGWFAGRNHARRLKAIAGVRGILARALVPGERVRFVTLGVRYSLVEMYFQGHFAMLNNSYVLVLTSQRLLMLQVHGRKLRSSDLKNDIPLAAIQSAKGRVLQLRLADRKKVRFSGIAGQDRKHLQKLITEARSDTPAPAERGMRHLCPGCLKVIPGRAGETVQCPNDACRIPLRSARRAAAMSALMPGVGDLYLRHFVSGTQEFLGSMVGLLIVAIVWLMAAYARSEESLIMAGVITTLCFVLPRIIDYPLTLHMARKGHVPLSYQTPVLPVGHALPSGTPAEPLPIFPRWVLGMFVLSGLALAGTVSAMQPLAVADGHVESAVRAAAEKQVDTARTHWQLAEQTGLVDANDRAKLALAYLRADLPEHASPLLAEIGEEPVEESLADAINELISRAEARADAP